MTTRPSPSELRAGLRFLAALPRFLRTPIDPPRARALVRQRLAARDTDFLTLVRQAVHAHPRSIYRALLRHAGCEAGDLERLVRADGVEGALGVLARAGVYLTVDELKGRRPVVRGTLTAELAPDGVRNPGASAFVEAQSSGSRGTPTPVGIDLGFVAAEAAARGVALAARGGAGWRLAYWDVPGGILPSILAYAKVGVTPVRWFSPMDPAEPGLHARYRWSARAMRWGGALAGRRLPAPEHVPVDRPRPIVDWLVAERQAGRTPALLTYSSPGVRVCRAAVEAGRSLEGVRLMLYGEPITAARVASVRAAGAEAVPLYVATETSRIAEGCLAPEAPDDVHVFDDLHSVIQPDPAAAPPGLPATTLLVSSIRPSARLVLLNVALGDQATLRDRACGCPLEAVGWRRHLHTIRSYEKLTAGGMTFLDTDVVRILEEVLPARFGGSVTDYQLIEGGEADGRPLVRLRVHPRLRLADPEAVRAAFLDAIGAGSGPERVMATVWRDLGLPRVEWAAPLTTSSGKILHLHVARDLPGTGGGAGSAGRVAS